MSSVRKSSQSLVAKVARLERRLASSNPETKYCDLDLSVTNVSPTVGNSNLMTSIAAGTGIAARIGNAVRVKSVELNFFINYTASILTAVNEDPCYRVYIVCDKQTVADAVGITYTDFVDVAAAPITQLRNPSTLERFRVLYDSGPQITFTGIPGTGVPNNTAVSTFKTQLHYKSGRLDIPVHYNGTASTDIQRNGIYIIVYTNIVGAAGVSIFDYFASSRVTFQDS